MSKGNIVLINPWIYDFAAYDLWAEPLGLLYIGGLLKKNYNVSLINCLDRYNPELLKFQGLASPRNNEYGCGKFHKEIIKKPDTLEPVPRKYGRYGLPLEIFRDNLTKSEYPDLVMITSGMTYWYPGVFAAIREVRNVYPKTPIILGGTYATLCYEHALQKSEADYVIKGEGELQALRLAEKLIGSGESQNTEIGIDDYPYPAHDLLTSQNSLAILTSRGCPMGCTYCASRLVAGAFRQRDPLKVADEIEYYVKEYRTSNFAFYDDALLINPDKHILILLDEIIRRELDCCFHTPNAMHASKISRQVAKMMFRAGFKTIRISLETSNDERQRRIGYKISAEGLRIAIENLKEAGYSGKDIGVYVLIGLPGQPLEEMIESAKYVRNCGAITKLAVYSPIPGTEEWKNAVARSDIEPDADPLLHNDSIYPVRSDGITIQDIQQVKALALKYNNAI